MRIAALRPLLGWAAAMLVGATFCATAATASPILCGSTIVLAGGNGFVLNSALTAGVCVQTSYALFGNFSIGGLPTGGSVAFNLTSFGSPVANYQGISFNDNYSAGHTYVAGFAVAVQSTPWLLTALDGDFTQNRGTSTLTTTSTEPGSGSIVWTKLGASGSGPDEIDYSPGVMQLDVTNQLVDNGSVSAISNTVTLATIPEPASVALLGGGLLWMALGRRRRV